MSSGSCGISKRPADQCRTRSPISTGISRTNHRPAREDRDPGGDETPASGRWCGRGPLVERDSTGATTSASEGGNQRFGEKPPCSKGAPPSKTPKPGQERIRGEALPLGEASAPKPARTLLFHRTGFNLREIRLCSGQRKVTRNNFPDRPAEQLHLAPRAPAQMDFDDGQAQTGAAVPAGPGIRSR